MDTHLREFNINSEITYDEYIKLQGGSVKILNIGRNGVVFRVILNGFTYCVKILVYLDDVNDGGQHQSNEEKEEEEEENEVYFNKLFTDISVYKTQHITRCYKTEKSEIIPLVSRSNDYMKFINRRPLKYSINIIYMEYCNLGDFSKHINTVSDDQITVILFQIFYTLVMINKKIDGYCFSDLHLSNIFMLSDENFEVGKNKRYLYVMNGKYYSVPVLPYIVKIGDYGNNYEGATDIVRFNDAINICRDISYHRGDFYNDMVKSIHSFESLFENDNGLNFPRCYEIDEIDEIDSFVSIFGAN